MASEFDINDINSLTVKVGLLHSKDGWNVVSILDVCCCHRVQTITEPDPYMLRTVGSFREMCSHMKHQTCILLLSSNVKLGCLKVHEVPGILAMLHVVAFSRLVQGTS